MNLHALAAGLVGTVNPHIQGVIRQSTGYTTNPDGTRVPTHRDFPATMQVQALSNDELKQVEGLNLQGNKKAVYLYGQWSGLVRSGKQGGDLLIFGSQTWIVAIVLEDWPDWTKVAVVLQDGE